MDKFWELMAQSTLVQGILTLMVVGAALWLAVQGSTVPEWLQNVVFAIVAFFFGAKTQKAANDAFVASARSMADSVSNSVNKPC